MALFALLMFAFAAAYGLVNAGLEPWAAFLIVGTVMLLVTALLGFIAYRQFNKITGPVMAQAELAKTTQVFADRRTAAAAAAVQRGRRRPASRPHGQGQPSPSRPRSSPPTAARPRRPDRAAPRRATPCLTTPTSSPTVPGSTCP